jgi:hypothetical protein
VSDLKSRVIASIGLLMDFADSNLLSQFSAARPKSKPRGVLDEQLRLVLAPEGRKYWALLEAVVIFDEIAYDEYAFQRFPMTSPQKSRVDLLKPLGLKGWRWPAEVYEKTGRQVRQWRQSLLEHGLLAIASDVPLSDQSVVSVSNCAFNDGREESYHDGLFEVKDHSINQWAFAETGETLERALFYAELTRTMGVGMLSRSWSKNASQEQVALLDFIGRSYTRCAYEFFHVSALEKLRTIVPQKMSLPLAPVAQRIALRSLESGISPIEIAMEMRDSTPAIAYRKHLAYLQTELRSKDVAAGHRIAKLSEDFNRIVDDWVAQGLPRSSTSVAPRRLQVALLPAITSVATYLFTRDIHQSLDVGAASALLAPFFPEHLTVKDPVLWGEQSYLAFVADWYR